MLVCKKKPRSGGMQACVQPLRERQVCKQMKSSNHKTARQPQQKSPKHQRVIRSSRSNIKSNVKDQLHHDPATCPDVQSVKMASTCYACTVNALVLTTQVVPHLVSIFLTHLEQHR